MLRRSLSALRSLTRVQRAAPILGQRLTFSTHLSSHCNVSRSNTPANEERSRPVLREKALALLEHRYPHRTFPMNSFSTTAGAIATSEDFQFRMNQERMAADDHGYHLALNRKPLELKKILLMSSSINSLTNAIHMHLQETTSYDLDVAAVSSEQDIQQAVDHIKPDLIVCPYLTKKIPSEVYENYLCWIVHPGIIGDRGAYSIDNALLGFEEWKPENGRWGVTVLQANEEYDAGAIWATEEFRLRACTKSELYHTEITKSAIHAVDRALKCYKTPEFMPISLRNFPNPRGRPQTRLTQKHRHFSWEDDSAETIARKINAASGQPGLKVALADETFFLYNAIADTSNLVDQYYTQDQKSAFRPGQMVLQMNGALLFATKSPGEWLWVTHMKQKGSFKLPAANALKKHATLQSLVENLPQHLPKSHQELSQLAWKEIYYELDESSGVAYLHFDLYNGAMSTDQASRLRRVYDYLAKECSGVKTIVLLGGRDSFSNGIHLNVIHDAPNPVQEATSNIETIDDVAKSILNTTDKLVISFIRCGAGAGGVMLSLAGDLVWCDASAVLHPYYKHMGLFGSEYWTYSLPRRVGDMVARKLTEECRPVSAQHAARIGLVDQLVEYTTPDGMAEVKQMVQALMFNFNWEQFLRQKAENLDTDKAEQCRSHELQEMYHSFRSEHFKKSCEAFVH